MQIGAALRKWRLERCYTQDQAAAAAGVTSGQISKIERDQHEPMFEVVRKLARFYGVDLEVLVYGEDAVAKRRTLKAIEDEQLMLGKLPDTPAVRERLGELSTQAAKLRDGQVYRSAPLTLPPAETKASGPVPKRARKKTR